LSIMLFVFDVVADCECIAIGYVANVIDVR